MPRRFMLSRKACGATRVQLRAPESEAGRDSAWGGRAATGSVECGCAAQSGACSGRVGDGSWAADLEGGEGGAGAPQPQALNVRQVAHLCGGGGRARWGVLRSALHSRRLTAGCNTLHQWRLWRLGSPPPPAPHLPSLRAAHPTRRWRSSRRSGRVAGGAAAPERSWTPCWMPSPCPARGSWLRGGHNVGAQRGGRPERWRVLLLRLPWRVGGPAPGNPARLCVWAKLPFFTRQPRPVPQSTRARRGAPLWHSSSTMGPSKEGPPSQSTTCCRRERPLTPLTRVE
jgi:hypothetical protein